MPSNSARNRIDPFDRTPEPTSNAREERARTRSVDDTIVEYEVPAPEFALGRAVTGDTTATLERLAPSNGSGVLYVWIEGGSRLSFERSARETAGIDEVRLLDQAGGQWLYRGESDPDRDGLVGAMLDHDVSVVHGTGDDDEWQFRLAAPDRSAVSAFQAACVESGVEVKLDGVYDPVEVSTSLRTDLTDRQRETLVRAYDQGYYEVPRGTTLVELADALGVSDQSVSERLRRGEEKLIRTHLRDHL